MVTACSSTNEAPQPTATYVPQKSVPTAVPTVEAAALPEEVEMVDECIRCHTDKEQLIDTAKPEVEDHESESEGEG